MNRMRDWGQFEEYTKIVREEKERFAKERG